MTRTLVLVAALVVMGAAWGGSLPLAKVAVSGGHQHFGLIFWQMLIGAVLLGGLTLARGKPLRFAPRFLGLYLIIALIGTVLPNTASYQAAAHLPAGVVSILISLVPMLAFPVALALGNDRFRWSRLVGLTLGLVGVALLVLPDTSLPDSGAALWIFVGMIAPLFYAFEGNYVARWGTLGLDPIQVLFGASVLGTVIVLPLAVATGQWIDMRGPWDAPERALAASSVLHAFAYCTYVWLVGSAGAVFAAQVAYFVTLFGVVWSMVFLNEVYSQWVWAALVVMLTGLAFVQPRPRAAIVATAPVGQDGG